MTKTKEILPSSLFTRHGDIGVEEEFYVVDEESLFPIEEPRDFLNNLPKELENNLDVELFDFIVETWIDKAKNLKQAFEEVTKKRKALKKHAKKYGYKILGAGLHPCINWKIYNHSKKPSYINQLKRIQYPQERNLTAGLHVHIGMDDEEKAIWLANEIRKYIPLFLALSSNSPFWQGRDTGLQSSRALIFENLPNTGIPSYHRNINQYRKLINDFLENEFIEEPSEIWWDVRINTKYGTLEIRAPDSQNEINKTKKLIKLIYEVTQKLKKEYEKGKNNFNMKKEVLVQNKWQAIRYGTKAKFILPNKTYKTKELLNELIKETKLNKKEMNHLYEVTGSEKQRKTKENEGINEVLRKLEINV